MQAIAADKTTEQLSYTHVNAKFALVWDTLDGTRVLQSCKYVSRDA